MKENGEGAGEMAGKKEGKSRGGRGGKAKKEALLSRDGAEGAAPTPRVAGDVDKPKSVARSLPLSTEEGSERFVREWRWVHRRVIRNDRSVARARSANETQPLRLSL